MFVRHAEVFKINPPPCNAESFFTVQWIEYMKELDDLTVQRAKKGDRASFKALYDYYAPFSWKIAYRTMHGDSEAAQEAVQETFIRVHNSLLGVWPSSTIARNSGQNFGSISCRLRMA